MAKCILPSVFHHLQNTASVSACERPNHNGAALSGSPGLRELENEANMTKQEQVDNSLLGARHKTRQAILPKKVKWRTEGRERETRRVMIDHDHLERLLANFAVGLHQHQLESCIRAQ